MIDFVPSVKMTAAVMIEDVIERELAGRMLEKAEVCHPEMLQNIQKNSVESCYTPPIPSLHSCYHSFYNSD